MQRMRTLDGYLGPRKGGCHEHLTDLHEPEASAQPKPEEVQAQVTPDLLPTFFADILLESDGQERRRRRWAAASSAIVQSLMLATMSIVPLMFTEALPKAQLLTFLVAPPPPPPTAASGCASAGASGPSH